MDVVAVTGATGEVGGRVARRLSERGVAQRLVVRDATRAPRLPGADVVEAAGYGDAASMRAALEGAGTLFFVPAGEARDRVRLHVAALDAALDAGVRRVVYLSFLNAAPDSTFTFARDHAHTEDHVRASGAELTILRASLYADVVPFLCGRDGVIRGPAGDGRFAPVARDDIADVAAAVLTGGGHDGATYDLTGPETLSLADVAEALARAAGRTVRYVDETLEQAYESRAAYGAPDWEVEGWVTSYVAIARGELDVVSDAVGRVAGHPPQALDDYLRAHPEALRHLAA